MNNNKVCIIYCADDKKILNESVRYVNYLNIPDGYEIEIITVEDTKIIPKAYNIGMLQSDAKYKVYLHNDVLILDKYFLDKLITLFQEHTNLGMFGIAGSANIPSNGKWWMEKNVVGKYYANGLSEINLVEYHEVSLEYEKVKSLCNSILVTQYDILWGEDYKSNYGISHSLEFIHQGYDAGVLRQSKPMILLNNSFESGNAIDLFDMKKLINSYDRFFRDEQISEENNLPLVSILIPTYNRPKYFELALQSALNQTYKNIEVIIGDDSTNTDTESLVMESYLPYYKNIYYVKNERNLGQFENDINLLKLAKGEYVNFLMDDDVFDHQKIKRMMSYFLEDENKEIKLVTSHRQFINENGVLLPNQGVTQKIFNQDTVLDGIQFGDFILKNNFNCIGEPTTALFRKEELKVPFGTFKGRKYGCNVDTATWLNLISDGKLVYISDTLSYFRIHGSQQLQSEKMLISGAEDYAHIILNARSKGFFKDKNEYRIAIGNCLKYVINIRNMIHSTYNDLSKNKLEIFIKLLNTTLLELEDSSKIIKSSKDNYSKLPLVSILIPAFNRPRMLEEALNSVLNQTYLNIEIIISDDSTNDKVAEMVKPYLKKFPYIKYIKNEVPYGDDNLVRCLELANGEYINFLMDDDLFHQDKIEKMIKYLINDKEIKLVTSFRQFIDENGNVLENGNKPIFNNSLVLPGEILGDIALKNNVNFIGEPTTVLFRKKDLIEEIGSYRNKKYTAVVDLATWISLLSQGNAVYISEPLSYFRIHSGQNQNSIPIKIDSISQWTDLIIDSRNDGFLQNNSDYKNSLLTHYFTCGKILAQLNENNNLNTRQRYKMVESVQRLIKEILSQI